MIAEIREHIKTCVNECSTYIEIDDPFFNANEVQESIADRSYNVTFGAATKIVEEDGCTVETIPATVRFYTEAGRYKNKDFDTGFTQALIINQLILDRVKLNGKEYMKGVNGTDVTPGLVPDSQNVYQYEATYTFTISYGLAD